MGKKTSVIPFNHLELESNLDDVAGQLANTSERVYRIDAIVFAKWLISKGLTPLTMTRSHAIEYRQYLTENYQKATAKRMFTVAKRLLCEYVSNHHLEHNPFSDIKGLKATSDETPHTALDATQARALLDSIDTSTSKGLRDYALLILLLKTGIRRAECADLTVGDMGTNQGYRVLMIRHGKGDKRRTVKLREDVYIALHAYLESISHLDAHPDTPLFIGFLKGDRPTDRGLGDKMIETIVKGYGHAMGIQHFTPHGARATFATVAFENKASLHQVQYAMGHADPRTTEHYQKRKLNLKDNAVDKLNF